MNELSIPILKHFVHFFCIFPDISCLCKHAFTLVWADLHSSILFVWEARWDPHGTHLATGCAWGGWRTKRHDDIATMMAEWINAAGGRAHERSNHWHVPTQGVTKKRRKRAARHNDACSDPGLGIHKPTRRSHSLRCHTQRRF